jgi:hypothetical protein
VPAGAEVRASHLNGALLPPDRWELEDGCPANEYRIIRTSCDFGETRLELEIEGNRQSG